MEDTGYYPYKPSSAGAIIFMLAFGASALFHLWQMIKTRAWFFTAFLIGAFMMTLGYVFRLLSARNPDSMVSYILQSMLIILPPSLYAATIYMTYGRIVMFVNKPHLSVVNPRKVTRIFVLGDTSAFLLQLAGGGMQTINSMRNIGEKVLVVGLIVQLIFFGFFLYVAVSFLVRLRRSGSGMNLIGGPWLKLLYVLFLVSALVIGRCVFRIIEYVGGTSGYVYSHEEFMYIFDAVPMFCVQAVFHFCHPGKVLAGKALEQEDPPVNALHLELFRHFITDILVFFDIEKCSLGVSATEMLNYILPAPFLMNQILALAAFHLSIVRPAKHGFYKHHATRLQTHALTGFNDANLDLTPDTCVPMFLFSSVLAIHILCDKLVFPSPEFSVFLDNFIQSLKLHRGVRAITNKSWHLLLQSPLKPLLEGEGNALSQASGSECSELLYLIECSISMDDNVRKTYRHSIEALQMAINGTLAHSSKLSVIGPIMSWPVTVSPEYVDLLSDRQPEALVILSHFGALLHMHRDMWMFGNSGLYIIESVDRYLGLSWNEWLRWPNSFLRNL
ncbi:hypothetical protein N8T08_000943 [Aspergillus melleus]|uniref:Uncharacterized protein n=1 Tax=Aspergillus melleus TaxID=138277 RepID=A0ACC3BAQ9_9EURO|nr:hypothetical protein N8T08_000943 [Aspergillus melleus]